MIMAQTGKTSWLPGKKQLKSKILNPLGGAQRK
jgi:hypothetical protein